MSLLVCGFVTLAVLVYVFYLPGVYAWDRPRRGLFTCGSGAT